MNDAQLTTLDQVRALLAGMAAMQFSALSDDAARYRFVTAVAARSATGGWDARTRD